MNDVITLGRENTQGQNLPSGSQIVLWDTDTKKVKLFVNNPILFLVQIIFLILK